MKKMSFLCLLLTGLFFRHRAHSQEVSIMRIPVLTDTTVISAAEHDSQLYGLQSDGHLILFDRTGTRLATYSQDLHNIREIFSERDTLFGLGAQDSFFYFSGTAFAFLRQHNGARQLYEDNFYVITQERGHDGGNVVFLHKTSGKKNSCPAADPVEVFSSKEGYIIIASQLHTGEPSTARTQVLLVRNPATLQPYAQKEKPAAMKSPFAVRTLLDTTGLMIIGAYTTVGNIICIGTDFNETFFCRYEKGRFRRGQLLSDASFWTDKPVAVGYKNYLSSFYRNNAENGFIYLVNGRTRVFQFKKEEKEKEP